MSDTENDSRSVEALQLQVEGLRWILTLALLALSGLLLALGFILL